MSRKKMRKIYDWRKEGKRKKAGRIRPASPYAFKARRNKRENKHTIINEALQQLPQPRRGGQWHKRIKIADDFDTMPEEFTKHFS